MIHLIYGLTDLAENLIYLLQAENHSIEGFVVDKKYFKSPTKEINFGKGKKQKYPIYPFEHLEKYFRKEHISIYVCIGYTQMNEARKRKIIELQAKGYRVANFISKSACVETEDIGVGNLIFEQAYVGMYVHIGDWNVIYPKALIAHHTSIGNYNYFAISASIAGHVKIGNQNFFGNNSTTKEKINIGDRNLIGAGAYVAGNLDRDIVITPVENVILKGKTGLDFL